MIINGGNLFVHLIDEVHGTSAPSFKTVYNWMTEFKCFRTSTRGEPSSGRLVKAETPGIIEKVHDMILNNRRVKMREIVEAIDVSRGKVITILHDKLSMKKVSARWVPRLLTVENKRNRVTDSMTVHEIWPRMR